MRNFSVISFKGCLGSGKGLMGAHRKNPGPCQGYLWMLVDRSEISGRGRPSTVLKADDDSLMTDVLRVKDLR